MANPNIVNLAAMYGNTASVSLTTTNATQLASNAASSGKVYKVNSIVIANTSATAANITVNVYSQATLGGTAYAIASTIAVPANASLIVTDKTTSFYLLENQSIGATAGTSSALVVTASWEELNA